MEEKLSISYPIVVEGKYDRLRVLSVANCRVICTDGFQVFRQHEKLAVIRALAKHSPIVLLTDSDGAGKLIRSYVTRAVPKEKLIQLYSPQIVGKEKRKAMPSAEGFLGVEGMERELLFRLLQPYAVDCKKTDVDRGQPITKLDFYTDGLSGGGNSVARRDEVAQRFDLPSGMTANALLSALQAVATYEEYCMAVGRK